MKTKFIAPNGVTVEGVVLYTSPITKSPKSFVNKVYDEIIYAQNRLVKLHHVMELDDEDNYVEFKEPQVEVISEYVVISDLDSELNIENEIIFVEPENIPYTRDMDKKCCIRTAKK